MVPENTGLCFRDTRVHDYFRIEFQFRTPNKGSKITKMAPKINLKCSIVGVNRGFQSLIKVVPADTTKQIAVNVAAIHTTPGNGWASMEGPIAATQRCSTTIDSSAYNPCHKLGN